MTKNINLFIEYALFFLCLLFSCIIAFFGNFSSSVKEGIELWVACVIPSLFPYFFITAILSSLSITSKISYCLSPFTKKVFKVNGTVSYALFISLISGYPLGAKMVSDLKLKGLLNCTEAVRASVICSSSSPMFLIGSVGSIMFNDKRFGITLFLCHILAVFVNGFIFSFYKKSEKPSSQNLSLPNKQVDNILYESVYSSVISILIVGGLITIFYTLTRVLYQLNLFNSLINALNLITKDQNLSQGLIFGIFECTQGLKELSKSGVGFLSLPLTLFICGFGGLSVIAQSIAFLKSAKIKTAPFLFSKVTSAVIGFLIGVIFSIFPL